MLYRTLAKTNEKVSALGFGTMRLPIIGQDKGNIDEKKAEAMIRYAVENGVNYIDTAYPYHNGQSEPFTGKVVKDLGRSDLLVATKLPSWKVNQGEDIDRLLNEQLERLQTDYIDFYLLHTLNKRFWETYKRYDFAAFLERAVKSGKIRYAGFSFHDGAALFKEIVDSYDWSFCQIQFNYLDENFQAGLEGLRYAAEAGLGIVIMEPLRGGSLAGELPSDVEKVFKETNENRSPVEWALRYVWDYPEVGTVLSGMSEMDHVKENLKIASYSQADALNEGERKIIYRVRDLLKEKMRVPCTSCGYCMPCPNGVNIPECFTLLNKASMFGNAEEVKSSYLKGVPDGQKAGACIECGICEDHCPQNIPIREKLKEVVETFGA